MTLWMYRWLTRVLWPLLKLWDWRRARTQPIYQAFRYERWAKNLPTPLNRPLIWIHAVSVGETQACAPLLKALLERYPKHGVLLSHMTPTGRDTGAVLFNNSIAAQKVQQCYLPYDIAGLPERFLKHFNPVYAVFMETELWPNCVAACTQANIPIGLANARMSEKTLRQSLWFLPLAQTTFNAFTWVAAQSSADAQRIAQLRSKPIAVTGNIKFDATPNQTQLEQGLVFKTSLDNRLVIALASTREGEETLLLNALTPWLAAQTPPPLILLIPRHPKRAAELLALTASLKLTTAQRSLGQTPSVETQVYLGDTLGEIWFYYGASDIAMVGGGWQPLGGQNLIEPCMAGCATIVGPHMFNFSDATRLALDEQGIIQCDIDSLSRHLESLLNKSVRLELARGGQLFAIKHAGATAKHLALVEETLR
jgi:3-deoxy-D-manno-octulosonic-acid transferase